MERLGASLEIQNLDTPDVLVVRSGLLLDQMLYFNCSSHVSEDT